MAAGHQIVFRNEFEPIDGGPETEFPKDVDGDGTVDFIRQDDSFRYEFASGAGSYSPPRIYNVYKGQIVDATEQSAYRPIWLTFANEVRKVCSDKTNPDRNGACIALAAAGARLGNFQNSFKEAVANANKGDDALLPSSCSVELIDDLCPKGKDIRFYSFESAANWFLRQRKYVE